MIFDIEQNMIKCVLGFTFKFSSDEDIVTIRNEFEKYNSILDISEDDDKIVIKSVMFSYFEFLNNFNVVLDKIKSKTIKGKKIVTSVSFSTNDYNVSNFNITKFILNYDEDFVLGKINDKDITKFKICKRPFTLDNASNGFEQQCVEFFTDTNDTCIDFTEPDKITINYFTSKDTENSSDILTCVNYVINCVVNTLRVNEYGQNDIDEIQKINDKFNDILDRYSSYEKFCEHYKEIELTVDLNKDSSLCNIYFNDIKSQLYSLISYGIEKCKINYDTDLHRLQIKEIEKDDIRINASMDIVESKIKKSKISNCDIYDSEFVKVTLKNCNLFGTCELEKCKLENCFVSKNINCKECSVSGNSGKFGGTLESGEILNTTVIKTSAIIEDGVKKNNVLEI